MKFLWRVFQNYRIVRGTSSDTVRQALVLAWRYTRLESLGRKPPQSRRIPHNYG